MKKSSNVGGGAQGAAAKNGTAGKNAATDDMNVKVFENPEFGRIYTMTDKNGDPLFCGKDVCDALGYTKADVTIRQHVNRGDVTKRYVTRNVKNQYGESSKQKLVNMLFVNESGFYCLVFGSKLETAQRFKHWVTYEVLPSIRKNGYYSMLQSKDKLITEQVARIRELDQVVGDQVVKLQKSAENIEALEKDIDRMLPKELYVDNVLDSISCYTTTQIAKELGITAQELNRSLCASHIQYYQSGQYMLYAEYAHLGLAKSRTEYKAVLNPKVQVIGEKTGHVYTHTYLVWTERGRKFIHDLAKRMWDLAEYERLKFKVRVKCFNKVQMPC